MSSWCCPAMQRAAEPAPCPQHPESCPDRPIERWSYDTYMLWIFDGGSSGIRIDYCPFCGVLLNR